MIAAVMAMLIMASVVAVFATMALTFSGSAVTVIVLAISVSIFARAAAHLFNKFKVYKGVLRIYCHQTNGDPVSYIEPFVAVNYASLSRRPE